MVPERRHSNAHAAHKAKLLKRMDPSVFEYHTKRQTGLIPQNEDPNWGTEHPTRRHESRIRHKRTRFARSFLKVKWDKGFTGRGVDFRRRDYRLEGPKGETLEHVAGAEGPTLPEARRLWQMVDDGEDEGVDPLYDGPPVNWDEDTSWSDHEGIPPSDRAEVDNEASSDPESQEHALVDDFSEMRVNLQAIAAQACQMLGDDEVGPGLRSQDHAPMDADCEVQVNLQAIAAQACQMLGDDEMSAVTESQEYALVDQNSEMRVNLQAIAAEASQMLSDDDLDTYQAPTADRASREPSPGSTKNLGKKRGWVSLGGGYGHASDEVSADDGSSHGPKRARTW